jgi:hypothetical protein
VAGKISVIGEVPVSATLAAGARGAQVVVAAAGEDVRAAVRLAPAAVVLLVDATPDDVRGVLDATLLPSHRVLGVPAADAERAAVAVVTADPLRLRATLGGGEREVTLARSGVSAVR